MFNLSKSKRQSALVIMAILSLFFVSKNAYALTLSPVRMEIRGNPGETVKEKMVLTNESEGTTTYYSSFSNFEASGESGNPSFVDAKNDLGSWMSADNAVTINANSSKTVYFSIKIPSDAEPGGHFAAIFWGLAPNKPGAVSIGARTGLLVLLSVNGDVKENAGLIDFSVKDKKIWHTTLPVSFTYRFKNDGGDRVKPVGKITMHDILYIPEDKINANPSEGNILPSSTRRFDITWVKNPRDQDYVAPSGVFSKFFDEALYEWHNYAFGPYFAKLNLLYGTSGTRITKTVFFFVFPWQLLICLFIIIMIIWWGGKKLIKRYNQHIIRKASIGMNVPTTANHA